MELLSFYCSIVSNSLQSLGLQHASLPDPSPSPRVCSNSCPSSQWCHPTISSSVILLSSHLQSFPASGSSPTSSLFTSFGQSIGASASVSVLPIYQPLSVHWSSKQIPVHIFTQLHMKDSVWGFACSNLLRHTLILLWFTDTAFFTHWRSVATLCCW